jgi:hypothetical protein
LAHVHGPGSQPAAEMGGWVDGCMELGVHGQGFRKGALRC